LGNIYSIIQIQKKKIDSFMMDPKIGLDLDKTLNAKR
jgi:hypothetical protein